MKIIRFKEIKTEDRLDGRIVSKLISHKLAKPDSMAIYLNFVPKGRFSFHKHSECEEIIFFPKGGKMEINGKEYLLEYAIPADFALIRAHKGDRRGNLVYQGTSRNFNGAMAGAATVTVAEVDEIVELGELDPEAIATHGIYVDRVVSRQSSTEVV